MKNSSGLDLRVLDELDADVLPLLVPSWNCFHSRGGRDDEQAKQRGVIVLIPQRFLSTAAALNDECIGAAEIIDNILS